MLSLSVNEEQGGRFQNVAIFRFLVHSTVCVHAGRIFTSARGNQFVTADWKTAVTVGYLHSTVCSNNKSWVKVILAID